MQTALNEWKFSLPGIETDTLDIGFLNIKKYIEFRKQGKKPNEMY